MSDMNQIYYSLENLVGWAEVISFPCLADKKNSN